MEDHPKINVLLAGIALFCTLAVFGLIRLGDGLFVDWESKTLDYRFKLRDGIARDSLAIDTRIVLIDIDDESIQRIGRWPWERSHHAEMIQILSQSGAAVIGYDILFSQPTEEAEDRALEEAIREAGNVYLPIGFELREDQGNGSLLSVGREAAPLPALREAAAGIGHISSNRDRDGTIRRIPLFVDADGKPFPAFSLAILAGFSNVSPDRIVIRPGEEVILPAALPNGDSTGEIRIPVDRQGMMMVNYAGRWIDTFDHYSFVDIIDAWRTEDGRSDLKKILNGKICLVSNAATGYDLKPVPIEADYPGGGIHANALNTLLTGRHLRNVAPFSAFSLTLFFSLVTAGLTIRGGGWVGLLTGLGTAVLYLPASVYLFHQGWVFPVLSPVLTVAFTSLSALLYQNRLSRSHVAALEKEKRGLGQSLQDVTQSLQLTESRMEEIQSERSHLLQEIQGFQGEDEEKLKRIEQLRSELERVQKDKTDLIAQKESMVGKLANIRIAPEEKSTRYERNSEALLEEFERLGILTRDGGMLKILAKVKEAAKSKKPVLIQGETGTGKELIARAVHAMSPRAKKPFLTVNVPALPEGLIESELFGYAKGAFNEARSNKEGKFQSADGGTLFLDEIGEMRLELQTRLLRALETGEVDRLGKPSPERVDVRIVAATNRNLTEEVERRNFRSDLFYRLNVLVIHLPPLRERPGDVELLARSLLTECAEEEGRKIRGFSESAMARIRSYSWPGNVRELGNVIVRAVHQAKGELIKEEDLELKDKNIIVRQEKNSRLEIPEQIEEGEPLSDQAFLALLRKNRFEIGTTAEQLGIGRGAVGSRFKGICLKALDHHEGDFVKAANEMVGDGNDRHMVEQRIRDYYANLLDVINQFQRPQEAIQECQRRYKNIPQKYLRSMEALVKRYFDKGVGTRH